MQEKAKILKEEMEKVENNKKINKGDVEYENHEIDHNSLPEELADNDSNIKKKKIFFPKSKNASSKQETDLEKYIRHYFAEELGNSEEMTGCCINCSNSTDSPEVQFTLEQSYLYSPSEYLPITLNRFKLRYDRLGRGHYVKNDQEVSFPQILNLSSYVARNYLIYSRHAR